MQLTAALRPLLRLTAPLTGRWSKAAEAEAPATPEPTPSGVHIVRAGDSIVRIAGLYGMSAYALMAANPQLMPSTDMVPGERIALPSRVSSVQVARPMAAAPARSRHHGGASRRVGQLAAA